jgi:ABC-type multidrug transport system ATPase subunit
LKICTEINEELTQQQKVVVLVQLLEYVKSEDSGDKLLTEQEYEFISTVADTFFIPKESFDEIMNFVMYDFDKVPESENVLIIDAEKDYKGNIKHLFSENLDGQIRVLNVESASMYLIKYIGQSEMYLNSQLLHIDKVAVFRTGSSIRNRLIKPIYYSEVIQSFNVERLKSRILFEVNNLHYKFKDGGFGLHNICFKEESGHLVGIMGASGSGKSTLLHSLNGTYTPHSGAILINGKNTSTEKDEIEGLIGMVPQDDLLIEELTVYQNLYYNAKLCFDNYNEEQIKKAVDETLSNLGLFEIKDIQVGNPLNQKISGGQRKRLNIALELIREPAILFLDEPTSGLSSRDSENILDLLKELALKGKLVFVVIHQPSSDIFKMFDRLLILDTGGYLIYNGNPIDSIIYFKSRVHHANWSESECPVCGNVNPEQIFNIIEANVVDEYGNLTTTRKITPKEWVKFYKEYTEKQDKEYEMPEEVPEINFKTPNRFRQFLIFMKRDMLSKLTNSQYLVINFLEAPFLAFLLSFIVKYYNVNSEHGYTLFDNSNLVVYLFMSVIVAIFIGLTVAAEEIIKDRKILKREQFLNLSWNSYLMSKVANLMIISAIQAFTYVIIGNSIVEIKSMYWQFWLVLFSAWVASNIMGLLISDSFKTVVTIYILIPFLIIPQLVLSGVIVKYEKINPIISSPSRIPLYGEIMTARWSYEALAVYMYKENKYMRELYPFEKNKSIAGFKMYYWIKELNKKISFYRKNKDNPEKAEQIANDLKLLRNEIREEMKVSGKYAQFKYLESIYPGKLTPDVINSLNAYLDKLQKVYQAMFNENDAKEDKLKNEKQKTKFGRELYEKTRREYHNDNLTEFVTNENEMNMIIEYKCRLIQKTDPIYLDPRNNFLKAHFYAPVKKLLGTYYPTFWINIAIIWVISIFLYIALYFRLLKKTLDYFESLSGRIKKLLPQKQKKIKTKNL